MSDFDIPDGFERQTRPSPLTDPWEPIYSRQTPDAIILGLRLAKPHTNARGFAHGGLIAALTDKAMGHSCAHKMRGAHSLVTVSMGIDFISSAHGSSLGLSISRTGAGSISHSRTTLNGCVVRVGPMS